jgi:hypothetical protein
MCGKMPRLLRRTSVVFNNLLILQVRPSQRLAMMLSVLHGIALVTIGLPLQLPEWIELSVVRVTLSLLIFMSYYHTLRYHVFLIAHPLRNCALYNNDVWLQDGQIAVIDSSSYFHPWLVVLRARLPSGRIYSLVIFPDALDADQFRQLRVRLRHHF